MYGPSRPHVPNMQWEWGNYRPQQQHNNPQWRFPGGPIPRAPFRGQYQRFNLQRPPFQSGNDNYWCETCDRGFPTEDILNKHTQQHQKCNIDGCQFVAHPKVITKHIQMQHSSGLYKKIANLKNPEEIEKWREERKKKYPTKCNIAKKAAELKEKIDRGEKMGLEKNKNRVDTPTSGYDNDNKQGQGFKRRNNMGNTNQPRSKFRRNNNNDFHNKKPQKNTPKKLSLIKESKRLKPFAGILGLQMESDNEIEETVEVNDLIEDDLFDESKTIEIEVQPENTNEPAVCGALSTLICDYGSSDEDGKKAIESNNIKKDLKESESMENKRSDGLVPQNSNQFTKATTHKNILEGVETNGANINNEYINSVENTVPNQNIDIDGNDSGPEEVKIVVEKEDSTLTNNKPKNVVVRKNTVTAKKQEFKRSKSKLPSTLLHKLLFKEMQQERNIVLQCIRYIRRNNYFDKHEE